jgi:hypothetical protein
MMLGNPVARVAETIGEAREIERIAQGNRAGGTSSDRREIEDGEGNGPCRHARIRTARGGASANPFSIP